MTSSIKVVQSILLSIKRHITDLVLKYLQMLETDNFIAKRFFFLNQVLKGQFT